MKRFYWAAIAAGFAAAFMLRGFAGAQTVEAVYLYDEAQIVGPEVYAAAQDGSMFTLEALKLDNEKDVYGLVKYDAELNRLWEKPLEFEVKGKLVVIAEHLAVLGDEVFTFFVRRNLPMQKYEAEVFYCRYSPDGELLQDETPFYEPVKGIRPL